ncbi:hypothetical protein BB561_000003 [Smittium simulii]|uniref:DNA-directed DNA polymerase n=1 Tax=Smittium simulii TaxID=133385 RepID=A0A2T9Z107_9FUNG|nr:hypothetical protein BB561_000003 [Smittium simulii]
MKDSIWYIEGDIKSYFDNINHSTLMMLIKKRLNDPPLLSNIYLHELDIFMEKLKIEYQGNVKPGNIKKNPLAHKLLNDSNKSTYYKLIIPSRIPNEIGYINCKNIRYADDFLVGILGSLRELSESFGCAITKSHFPYEFVNKDNLYYVGAKPNFKYYKDLDQAGWKPLPEVWDFNYPTISSLALGIFLTKYSNYDKKVSVIKGIGGQDIRKAYYGGITQVLDHEIKDGYYYDTVSQYPASMKNPMPVDKSIVPAYSEDGIFFPTETFEGWYFSEEIKNAIKLGYKVNISCGYEFEKGFYIFDGYVHEFFNIKQNAKTLLAINLKLIIVITKPKDKALLINSDEGTEEV